MFEGILSSIGHFAPAIVIVLIVIVIFIKGYVKASPDTAIIISGMRKKPKILIGKAGIKVPFFEKKDELSLQLIPINVKTATTVPTADYINIRVDAAVNVKVSDNMERLNLAAQNFLNKPVDYIGNVAREVLEGNMREIVGKMRLEEMVSDRQKFSLLVTENAEPNLAAMGLDVVSFNVQNFEDNNGVIENLGVDNVVRIQKDAAISRAESEKEIAKAQSAAEKEANEARVNAQTEIAQKNTELAIRQAELKKEADIKQAEADAAYKIQAEEQRKTTEVATAEANIAQQEKQILLKHKEAEVMEQSLNAEVRKKAEASRFAKQQQSEAELFERQKNAEAKKYEMQQEAEALKTKAEAEQYAKEQEARGIRMVGEAEAEAIKAKGLAEAEAMEKKAEAYQKYNSAAMAEMLINVLPDIAGKIAEPLTKIDKITLIGGDGGNGVDSIAGNVPAVMAKLFESMKETVGIDLNEIVKASTYDAKVTKNLNVTGLEGGPIESKAPLTMGQRIDTSEKAADTQEL